jgi:hypothetical protein
MDSEETKSPVSDKIALLDNLVGIIPSDNLEIVDIREERLSEQSALD